MNKKINHQDFSIARDHLDLAILCKCTQTKPSHLGSASSTYNGESIESNYMRVHSLKYWEDADIVILKEAFEEANELTQEYDFEFTGLMDFEVEYDNDRTWPAAFSFRSVKKINQSNPSK